MQKNKQRGVNMNLNNYWVEGKKPNPELFYEGAKQWADEVHSDKSNYAKNSGSQLRKFFDEILNYKIKQQEKNKKKLNTNINELDMSIMIKIKMMPSKIAYAYGRKNIGDKYKNLFKQGIKKIKTSDDLCHFSDFLECFTGFYREKRPHEK